ncbi:MAG: ABC transporter permease [Acidimicrobiales bacterium]
MRAFLRSLRRSPLLLIGTVILFLLVVIAVLAPWIAPYDPQAITGDAFVSPSSDHLLGTNDAGSDIFSRLVMGSRTTLTVAVSATVMILVIGLAVGLTAGLRGGFIDTALMRVVDVILALPILPLVIFIAALAGPSLVLSILMIGLFTWPETARIVRSQTISLRSRGFIDCARAFGAGPLYVMRRHLVPALGPIIAANLVYVAGTAITIEAGLAFIGLGDPAAVSWGAELNRALSNSEIYIGSLWVSWLLPAGLALTLAILSFTFIGVGLEPRFNPRANRAR